MAGTGVDRSDARRSPRNGSGWVRRSEFPVLVVAGFAVLATGWLRWVSSGPGSRFSGLRLADALRGNDLVPDAGEVVAAALYAVVASGGLLVASSGLSGRVVAGCRLIGSVLLVVPLLVAGVLGWFPFERWSVGPVVVVVAGAAAGLVSALHIRTIR